MFSRWFLENDSRFHYGISAAHRAVVIAVMASGIFCAIAGLALLVGYSPIVRVCTFAIGIGLFLGSFQLVDIFYYLEKHRESTSTQTSTQNREFFIPSIYRCCLGHEASKNDVESGGGKCPECGLSSYETTTESHAAES